MVQHLRAKQQLSGQGIVQCLLDACLVAGMALLIQAAYTGGWSAVPHGYGAAAAAMVFVLVAMVFGAYQLQDPGLRSSGYGILVSAWLTTISIVLLLAYGTKTSSSYSRVVVSLWLVLTPLLLLGSRVMVGQFFLALRKTSPPRKAAVVGYSNSVTRFIASLQSSELLGIEASGLYVNQSDQAKIEASHQTLYRGGLEQVILDARQGMYDEVYVSMGSSEENELAAVINSLSDCSVPVYFIPDIFLMNLLVSKIYYVRDIPIVSVYDSPMSARDLFLKRLEDLVLATLILALIALPMFVIAVCIKATSKGPVLFKQRRYGLGGKEIEVWKFRSMTVCDDGAVIKQATKGDSRITPLGNFLRKTSLDELPQFLNVLKGDMSIVGPRPHAVAHNELYRKEIHGYMLRHLVKPGITGWAQINGWRGETDVLEKMEKRVEYDLEYIRRWSIWFDLKIIFLTVISGFIHKNAY